MAYYEKSVFINCPYDDAFGPLFHAIVPTAAACGFVPRCARETEWKGKDRATRIADLLLDRKYSIHDLSRHQGEGNDNLARLNMAFELGMAFGIQQLRSKLSGPSHEWLVLGPPGMVIERVISDLKGYRPVDHDQTVLYVIARVWDWLTQLPDFETAPTAKMILDTYPEFVRLLKAEEDTALLKQPLPWTAILKAATTVAAQVPPAPLA